MNAKWYNYFKKQTGSFSLLGIYPEKWKCVYTQIHIEIFKTSFICNRKILETIQKSVSQWMDTFMQWNGSNKNAWTTDTCNNMGGCQKHSTQWKYKRVYNHGSILVKVKIQGQKSDQWLPQAVGGSRELNMKEKNFFGVMKIFRIWNVVT